MNQLIHYSEEDFQNYFDNQFTGDVHSLENHIKECEQCHKIFEAYSTVWSFTKNDLKTESLKIDLALTVANRIFIAKELKPVLEPFMHGVFICLGIVCFLWCLKFLISLTAPIILLLLIIPICMYFFLSYKEIRIVSDKFSFN